MTTSESSETWYGIVFGIKPYSKQENQQKILTAIENQLTVNADETGIDSTYASFFNIIARVHNSATNSVLSFHDGFSDPSCQYQGNHWHWVVQLRLHPTRDARWGRNLLELSRKSQGAVFFASQVAKDACALQRHVIKAPRKIVIAKGSCESLGTASSSTSQTEDQPILADTKAKISKDKSYWKITFLTEMMQKYRTPDLTVLKPYLYKNKTEWQQFRELQASPSFDQLVKKATEIFKTEHCQKNLEQMLLSYKEYKGAHLERNSKFYSVKESVYFFEKWCTEQGFDKNEFVADLFAVLTKQRKKINTFVLQGEPNSGKSWIMRSLLPIYMFYGEIRGNASYNFMWQDCIDTPLIFIKELMITPEMVEQCKLVFEGAPTYVHIKMRGDSLLQSTPVIITCNHTLWKWCSADATALKARMILRRCKAQPWLKGADLNLNPLMWCGLFKDNIIQLHRIQDSQLDWHTLKEPDEDAIDPPRKRPKHECDCGKNHEWSDSQFATRKSQTDSQIHQNQLDDPAVQRALLEDWGESEAEEEDEETRNCRLWKAEFDKSADLFDVSVDMEDGGNKMPPTPPTVSPIPVRPFKNIRKEDNEILVIPDSQ